VNVSDDAEIIALEIEPEAEDALPFLEHALGGPGGPAGVSRAEVVRHSLMLDFRPARTPWPIIKTLIDAELSRFGSTTRRTTLRSSLSPEMEIRLAAAGLQCKDIAPDRVLENLIADVDR